MAAIGRPDTHSSNHLPSLVCARQNAAQLTTGDDEAIQMGGQQTWQFNAEECKLNHCDELALFCQPSAWQRPKPVRQLHSHSTGHIIGSRG